MSFTNTKYDNCAYKKQLQESTSVLGHIIEPNRYVHDERCRHSIIGILQNNPVDRRSYNAPDVNLVDTENDLYGLTRPNSRCPSVKYSPDKQCPNKNCSKSNTSRCPSCIKHIDTHTRCVKPIIRYKKKVNYTICNNDGCYRQPLKA